jgi:hypothetical protein
MKVVNDEATLHSLVANLGKFIKKLDVLLIEEKPKMLAQLMCQPTFPSSLNLKFRFFACKISS